MRFNKLDLNLLVALDALLTERRMEPTPRADTLQEAVRDVLLRIDTTISAQPDFDPATSDREFTLFVSDYSMQVLIPHALALLSRQRGTVRLKLLPQVAQPFRALERGEADLLIIPAAYVFGAPQQHPVPGRLRLHCVARQPARPWRVDARALPGRRACRDATAGNQPAGV
jgi:DNA-binding transcriptional LysR family regulator